MEKEQELEWLEAQNIVVSEDLVAVAKKQLQFLAIVDKHRCLYEGPTLQKAIFRYNACWLPLLAKHSESQIFKGPLVVPLDCEWIWHCHRLNPVRYKTDCEELYGRILDNYNVVSSVQGTATSETEEIWSTLYPKEPYLLDLTRDFSKDTSEQISECEKHTKYDLVSAVKRQSPFCYQVSRPHMNNQLFLEGAVARYKGFLYLIKKNRERSIRRFCVPTYDIDLIWHSHQLHPVSYCKDLRKLVGKVLEHDDMDADRTKGKKLDVGFSETTEQWEETFGSRYWRAGAMYRGSAPSPLTTTPYSPNMMTKKVVAPYDCQKMIQLPEVKVVEVLLEIVGVKNLPVEHKGSLFVSFTKAQPDTFFNAKRRLTIFSESGEKQVASFQCEPTGELQFQLISHSPSNLPNLPILWSSKKMGSTSISLQEFLAPISSLSVEKWLELVPSSGNVSSKPICLRIAISFTVPALAPRIFHTVCSRPFLRSSCFFPLPGRIHHAKRWTRVIDETGSEVISLQMRDSKKATTRDTSVSRREVIGVTKSLETITLAEFVGTGWSLLDYNWCLKLEKKSGKDGHLFELVGNRMVKIYPGRKLEFEPKHCERRKSGHDFLTAVEFSAEVPYGRAVALLDLKSGFLKVNEEWLVLPGIILVFVLSDILRKEGSGGFTFSENLKEMENLTGCHEEEKPNLSTTMGTEVELKMEVAERNAVMPEEGRSHSGGCGSDCGGGCGNMSKSGGCGGCGGCSGCGNMVKSGGCGGCGSGCGGCGSRVKSGGCGGCGGGGCGGCGGGGCGSRVKSGGCGGCGGGGSGIRLETGDSAGESAYEASAGNPCIDEHLRKAPTHMNATVVA